MLYHKNLGFPRTLNISDNYNLSLNYSSHALQACKNDVNGLIDVTKYNTVNFQRKQIIEIETPNNKKVEKVVVRMPYDNKNDLIVVIMFDVLTGTNLVKTVWLNNKADNHSTLNLSKYDKPQQTPKIKF